MFALVLALLLLAFSVVADRTLALFGVPQEVPVQVTHPLHFRELRRNVEFTYEFATNSRGLRHQEIPLEKPQGSYRVLVVGDSMTEGVGVEADETFSARLEEHFRGAGRNVEFINGGLGGTGVFEYGRLFLSVGVEYAIDALLIAVFANDVSNSPIDVSLDDLTVVREGKDFFGPVPDRTLSKRILHSLWPRIYTSLYLVKKSADMKEKTQTTNFVPTISREARRRGIPEATIEAWAAHLPADLVDLVNQGRLSGNILSYGLLNPRYCTDSLDIDTPAAESRYRSMRATLTRIVEEARRRGIEVALLYLPDRLQYDPEAHEDNPFREAGVRFRAAWLRENSELQTRLSDWSESKRVPFLDLTPAFRAKSDWSKLSYKIDGHWTAAGHRVAAEAIGEWLEGGNAFKWQQEERTTETPG